MPWEKSSFWSITVSHSTSEQVLWHRQVFSTSVNTKSLILCIHLLCQLPLVAYTQIYLGGTQQDQCDHTHPSRPLVYLLKKLKNSPKTNDTLNSQNPKAKPEVLLIGAAGQTHVK